MNVVQQLAKFGRSVWTELKAVEWVGRKDLAQYTAVVVAFSLGLTVLIYVLDIVLIAARSSILTTNTI